MTLPEDFDPPIGVAEDLAGGLRRIVADNPGPMTWRGTNTYLLGTRDLAVIDPGPDSAAHLDAILRAVQPGQRISHIFVTHAHLDHSPLARGLANATGAPVLAFGDATAGRTEVMRALADSGLAGGGEGVDAGFAPDQVLADGQEVAGDGWSLRALWTPGHFSNHLAFVWGDAVFSGDLVMGWATSLVSPPDGDLGQFMASCARLRALAPRVLHTGHGAPVVDPVARIDALVAHRQARGAQIVTALRHGPATADALARRIYTDTPPALLPAAARNVFAHLIDMTERGQTTAHPNLSAQSVFALVPETCP